MPPPDRQALGKTGEDLACGALARRGYEILARRYRTRYGEIDIIARDGETIVFVEVKARTSARYGWPGESVTRQKQQRLAALATAFLQSRHLLDRACRFDVVAITIAGTARPVIEIVPDAFELEVEWR